MHKKSLYIFAKANKDHQASEAAGKTFISRSTTKIKRIPIRYSINQYNH